MLIVHIGAKKAGSSSIQAFLSANEEVLRQASINYTTIGRKGDRPRGDSGEDKQPNRALEDDQNRYKIVFIIRDLVDLIPSTFSQQTRHGFDQVSFDEFFEEMIAHPKTDFFNTAKRWANVFGWKAMQIRALDGRDLKNGDLLDEFVSIMEAEQIQGKLEKTRNRNSSGGWKSLEAVRALFSERHKLPPDHPLIAARDRCRDSKLLGKAAMQVSDKLGWDRDARDYLTVEQAERCIEKHRAAIDSINRHISRKIPAPLDLEARNFRAREFEPDVSRIPPNELRSFYDEAWAFIGKKDLRERSTDRGSPRNHKSIALELSRKKSPQRETGLLEQLSREWHGGTHSALIVSSEFFEATGRQGIVKLRDALSTPRRK